MKKRLLITSIVMMLVVAVALSTATYAWFTSNTIVTASTVSFTANTSDADSIAIAWTGNDAPGTTLTAATARTEMNPMVPSAITIGSQTSTAFAAAFKSGTLYSNNGVPTFNTDVDVATPVTWETTDNGATPAAAAQSFYIKNMSLANTVGNIKVTATITDSNTSDEIAADELVRIAVFTKDLKADGKTSEETDYILRGVLAKKAASTAVGNPEANVAQATAVPSASAITATAANEGFKICKKATNADQSLAANNQVDVVVIVWMDGEALTDTTAGVAATISLTFSAVAA